MCGLCLDTTPCGMHTCCRWVLYHITRGGADRIDAMLRAGILPRLPDLLLHDSSEVMQVPRLSKRSNAPQSAPIGGACSAAGVRRTRYLVHDAGCVGALVRRLGNRRVQCDHPALEHTLSRAICSTEYASCPLSPLNGMPFRQGRMLHGGRLSFLAPK